MYRAKEQGGARLELYDENSRKRAIRRRPKLEDSLRGGHQPLRSCASTTNPECRSTASTGLLGFEALVRWEHPERGLIEAGQFVSLAEETGLIVPIGEWVLEQALGRLRRWRQTRPDVSISVNLSARQLEDAGLVATLAAPCRPPEPIRVRCGWR